MPDIPLDLLPYYCSILPHKTCSQSYSTVSITLITSKSGFIPISLTLPITPKYQHLNIVHGSLSTYRISSK